jgi:hypothetical protein
MRDRWDKYFKSKRPSFDDLEAPEFIWDKIEAELKTKRLVRENNWLLPTNFLRIAAVFIVCSGISLLVWFGSSTKKSQSEENQSNYVFLKEEKEMSSLIHMKKTELKQVLVNDPELYKEFNGDLDKLEVEYLRLKQKLNTSPSSHATINALIINLNAQLNALNQQTSIIYKIQNHESKGI